jgi:hypothetical protein
VNWFTIIVAISEAVRRVSVPVPVGATPDSCDCRFASPSRTPSPRRGGPPQRDRSAPRLAVAVPATGSLTSGTASTWRYWMRRKRASFAVRRGLSPLIDLGRETDERQIEAGRSLQPLNLSNLPVEAHPSVRAMNQLFGRLEARSSLQQPGNCSSPKRCTYERPEVFQVIDGSRERRLNHVERRFMSSPHMKMPGVAQPYRRCQSAPLTLAIPLFERDGSKIGSE